MIPNITINHDHEEQTTVIRIDQGRLSIVLNCYADDEGAAVIDIKEKLTGYIDRRLAFLADGEETKTYGLNAMGREELLDHPSPESVQRDIERAEYLEER